MPELNFRIQNKHDSEANWSLLTSFVPKAGEMIIYDMDANHDAPRIKIGDGVTVLSELPFTESVAGDIPAITNQEISSVITG